MPRPFLMPTSSRCNTKNRNGALKDEREMQNEKEGANECARIDAIEDQGSKGGAFAPCRGRNLRAADLIHR